MNLLRSSTLLIIGLIILVGERIYFVHKNDVAIKTGENIDIAAQNATYNDYNQYLQGTRPAKNNTINTNAYSNEPENEKNVLHTGQSRLKASPYNGVTGNASNDPWAKYSDHLPKVFMLKNTAKAGVDYSNKNISYLKQLANEGDILAKFLYGHQLSKAMETDMVQGKGDIAARTAEVRELYIESASKGLHAAAHELSRLYFLPRLHDLVEALSWALIADAMRDGGERSVSAICSDKKANCTGSTLAQAATRARGYLSTYAFKIESSGP